MRLVQRVATGYGLRRHDRARPAGRILRFRRTPIIHPHELDPAIRSGLAQLAAMQMPDGSFPLSHHDGTRPPRPCHGLFSTLTVLLATGDLLPADSRSAAIAYVIEQRRADGLWMFDPDLPIPADSDCLACALAALARNAHAFAASADVDLLRSFWRADDGPFLTWQDAPGEWLHRNRDDAVVNCNVLLALRALGAPPIPLETRAVLELVNRSVRGTRYYCSPATIVYAARRAGLPMDSIDHRLRARPPREGVLPEAQWLSAIGQWDDQAIAHVLSAQSASGAWASEDWFRGVGADRWGSAAVSTALCVEGLRAAARAVCARSSRRIFAWLRW